MALAAWTGWAVYIFAAVLFLHALLFGSRKHQVATFGLGIIVGLMGLLFLLHLDLTTEDGIDRLVNRYGERSSSINMLDNHVTTTQSFTMPDFFLRMFLRLLSGYTPTTVAFAGIALLLLVRRPGQWKHLPLGNAYCLWYWYWAGWVMPQSSAKRRICTNIYGITWAWV
jgi:hypothetical protein